MAESRSVYRRLMEQGKQRWIPCSERLPERGRPCLVTDEERKNSYEFVLCDLTIDRRLGWSYEGRRIIAWMPLPEPYKGEPT